MEVLSKILEQIAFNTKPKIEGHMLIVKKEEYLHQPLQTNNKQLNIAVTFLTGFYGSFNVQIKILTFIS